MINRTNVYTVLVTYEDGSSAFCAMVENDEGVGYEVRTKAEPQSWYDCERVQAMIECANRELPDLQVQVSIVRADGGRDE